MRQPPTKEEARQRVQDLVKAYSDNIKQYHLQTYKEAELRLEYIDDFFRALGWDVGNKDKLPEQFKDVVTEDSLEIEGNTKAPDYAFRIGGQRMFFVEAKKPIENIKEDPRWAFQARRYGFSGHHPVSLLTNFETLIVYDCRVKKPQLKDGASMARLLIFDYTNYVTQFDDIWDKFSYDAVIQGSFERWAEENKIKKGTIEVDVEFLREIESWREELAKCIALRNPDLSLKELNFAVQKTINRIIFLIICEYRSIEKYERLKEIAMGAEVYKNLLPYFQKADGRYNSGIFDFEHDKITQTLHIDDKVLKDIILDLYYPNSPYDFKVLNIEILGSVYEQFLGKTIRLTSGHHAKVEEKLEVRKAGGVYYTPEYVVNYIVRNTVGKAIEGKSPKQIESLRVLDPACGSGTFLVRAFTYLLDYHLDWYVQHNPAKYRKEVYLYKGGRWMLATEVKKRVLLNNIYGVDIDPQAVELAKLSLLLKVLEDETKEKVEQQLKLFQERILPNLDDNIRCGNSVVDSSYFDQTTLEQTDDISRVNPFDWDNKTRGFGKIKGEGGFDVIIGNPPYVKEYTITEIFDDVKKTDLKRYYQGKMDFWYFFTCQSIDLLKPNGLHGFIAPNNWITNAGASILRNKIISESEVLSYFDFNSYMIFKDASIQTMVFTLQKTKPRKQYSFDYFKIIDPDITKEELRQFLLGQRKSLHIEKFKVKMVPQTSIDKTITFSSGEINDILETISGRSNYRLKDEDVSTGIDVHQDFVTDKHLAVLKDAGIKKREGIFNITSVEKAHLQLSPEEESIVKPFYTTEELGRYYGTPNNKLWIVYTDLNARKNIKQYPHIRDHLERFKKIITSDFAPYGLHRPREQKFFEGEKIISLRKTPKPWFTYTDFPCYVSQTYFVIKPSDTSAKFLTGLLNSNVVFFWLKHKGKKQGDALQIDKAPLLEIPLYVPGANNKQEVALQVRVCELVDAIRGLYAKMSSARLDSDRELLNKQAVAFEHQVDDVIYTLYGLSAEDKAFIEENLS